MSWVALSTSIVKPRFGRYFPPMMIGNKASVIYPAELLDVLETGWDFVRWGTSRFNESGIFFGHGTDNALDEALVLVRHALYLPPDVPHQLLQGRLSEGEKHAILTLFLRRVEKRIPAAYLTREAWFAGIKLYVDERVLIPRSPIAEWIELGFSPWIDQELYPDGPGRILDLGTGSGCIAIALALAFPNARIDAVDISSDAIAVAKRNVLDYGLGERVHVIESDLFTAQDVLGPYDLIVSNPPYVDAEEISAMPAEYRHEPSVGLVGGQDGLTCVRTILHQAGGFLTSDGILVVEVGASRFALEREFPDIPLVWLDLALGGENVCLINAQDLCNVLNGQK